MGAAQCPNQHHQLLCGPPSPSEFLISVTSAGITTGFEACSDALQGWHKCSLVGSRQGLARRTGSAAMRHHAGQCAMKTAGPAQTHPASVDCEGSTSSNVVRASKSPGNAQPSSLQVLRKSTPSLLEAADLYAESIRQKGPSNTQHALACAACTGDRRKQHAQQAQGALL